VPKLKLGVFDVDGTLTSVESCWRFIHERLGTWRDVGERNAELFFRGVISYDEWARRDVLLWKGKRLSEIRRIVHEVPYVDGIKEVFQFLRRRGIKIVLLSAGLSLMAERIAQDVGVDGYVANELEVVDGQLTGKVRIRVSVENKDKILRKILGKFGLEPKECFAVGDDQTMIPVFQNVGLGIAFNPQNKEVCKYAKITIKKKDLREIIPHVKEYL